MAGEMQVFKDDTTKNQIVFGIVVDVNGTEVPISTETLEDIKQSGLKFALPKPVTLGSFDNLTEWLKTNFKVDIPSADNLPSPLNDMVNAITSLKFTVEALKFDIPGVDDKDGKTTYLLRIAGSWDEAKQLIPGVDVLKLKGGVFGVTNMPNPAS